MAPEDLLKWFKAAGIFQIGNVGTLEFEETFREVVKGRPVLAKKELDKFLELLAKKTSVDLRSLKERLLGVPLPTLTEKNVVDSVSSSLKHTAPGDPSRDRMLNSSPKVPPTAAVRQEPLMNSSRNPAMAANSITSSNFNKPPDMKPHLTNLPKDVTKPDAKLPEKPAGELSYVGRSYKAESLTSTVLKTDAKLPERQPGDLGYLGRSFKTDNMTSTVSRQEVKSTPIQPQSTILTTTTAPAGAPRLDTSSVAVGKGDTGLSRTAKVEQQPAPPVSGTDFKPLSLDVKATAQASGSFTSDGKSKVMTTAVEANVPKSSPSQIPKVSPSKTDDEKILNRTFVKTPDNMSAEEKTADGRTMTKTLPETASKMTIDRPKQSEGATALKTTTRSKDSESAILKTTAEKVDKQLDTPPSKPLDKQKQPEAKNNLLSNKTVEKKAAEQRNSKELLKVAENNSKNELMSKSLQQQQQQAPKSPVKKPSVDKTLPLTKTAAPAVPPDASAAKKNLESKVGQEYGSNKEKPPEKKSSQDWKSSRKDTSKPVEAPKSPQKALRPLGKVSKSPVKPTETRDKKGSPTEKTRQSSGPTQRKTSGSQVRTASPRPTSLQNKRNSATSKDASDQPKAVDMKDWKHLPEFKTSSKYKHVESRLFQKPARFEAKPKDPEVQKSAGKVRSDSGVSDKSKAEEQKKPIQKKKEKLTLPRIRQTTPMVRGEKAK